ncbi:MAG: nucleotidyl transferase AbiEii/AbiGii toxin family protein [Burkholderiaceae bacterium]|nr:nucleotidyl transferase AbiEii/AbiGii toxin family protein [Burkholderiaceae bacterium]
MPTKRVIHPDEQTRLRDDLQAATLAALIDSRRWQPGDLAFQGGNCLHMAHGSARYSEDLDFMIRGGLSLDGLADAILRRLRLPASVPRDLSVSVSPARTARNPHAFMVTLGGTGVIGSVKVKVELWKTDPMVMETLQIKVTAITSASGVQTFVPVITLEEILADKVYALGARDRLKPRDVFDLWWLQQRNPAPVLDAGALCSRLLIYPKGDPVPTGKAWLKSARPRLALLKLAATAGEVSEDLARWLPSSMAMDKAVAREMLNVSASQLDNGVTFIRDFAQTKGRAPV